MASAQGEACSWRRFAAVSTGFAFEGSREEPVTFECKRVFHKQGVAKLGAVALLFFVF